MSDTRSTLLLRVRDPADAGAWREFVELYRPLLLAYVRKQGRSGPDADDVVQDVLARLVKSLPRFELNRVSGRFRTWLWQVTRSALVDDARRRRRRECAEQARAGEALFSPDGPSDEDQEPDRDWLVMHRRRVIEYARARVRVRSHPRSWACFEEHVLRGRPSAEVAAEMGLSANAVDVNSSRILTRLRSYCNAYLEGLADGDDRLPAG